MHTVGDARNTDMRTVSLNVSYETRDVKIKRTFSSGEETFQRYLRITMPPNICVMAIHTDRPKQMLQKEVQNPLVKAGKEAWKIAPELYKRMNPEQKTKLGRANLRGNTNQQL